MRAVISTACLGSQSGSCRTSRLTHPLVVSKLCLLLRFHPANMAVITELFFLVTWKYLA